MGEVVFVLKSLLITVLLLVLMQVKVGSNSIEKHSEQWLQTSQVSLYMQKVASGAVLFLHNTAKVASDLVAKTFNGMTSETRASRLNIEFKRSPKIEEQQKQTRQSANE